MLIVEDVEKILPNGRLLFRDVTLRVAPGECVAILGESGVGKSTLLNIIAGLEVAEHGSIEVGGQSLSSLDEEQRTSVRRQNIGFVFQAFHVLPHLSLAQNVALTLILNGVEKPVALRRAVAALDEVGLARREHDFPRQLSGGELQRVAIARALVHRPALLLADEPTGNLDPENAQRVVDLMARLMRESNTATVIVTHSDATAAIADRRLLLTPRGLSPQ